MCNGRAGLFCVLFCVAAALSWSQDTSGNPRSSNAQESSWDTLDKLLTELAAEAQSLSDDSEKLQALLDQARIELVKLQSKLEESRTEANALSRSLTQSAQSLATSAQLLNQVRSEQSIELWIWRGATVVALVGCVFFALK